jgi:hypothetical protein
MGALVVTNGGDGSHQTGGAAANFWSSSWPVVGKTVLQRWIERVRELGVGMVSVVNRDVQPPVRMLDWAKEGVDRILLIVSGSYAEIDLADLLDFHQQGRNCITRVFDKQGPLGISLLDRGAVLKIFNLFIPLVTISQVMSRGCLPQSPTGNWCKTRWRGAVEYSLRDSRPTRRPGSIRARM